MSEAYRKGVFVMDYLKSIGLDMLTIGDAICDENFEKSYEIITQNPSIGKYEFIEQLGIDYDEEELQIWDFLYHLQMPCYHIEEAFDEEHYEKTLNIMQTRPEISREEFLEIMQFTDKYKEYFTHDQGADK